MGVVDLIKSKNEPVKRNHSLSIGAIIVGLIMPLLCWAILDAKSINLTDNTEQNYERYFTNIAEENSEDDDNDTEPITTTIASEDSDLSFNVSSDTQNLSIGDIASYGDYYVGLACVRSLDQIQTAVSYISDDIPSNQEVIYPIIQVYNNTNSMETLWDSNVSLYADSVQGSNPDTPYDLGIDGIAELDSYVIDPGKVGVVITGFVVERGWSELTIFFGNVSWTVTADEISNTPYTYSCMFGDNLSHTPTEEGTIIYSGDYELTYDGFEIYNYNDRFAGTLRYAIFEFTINNTSNTSLDYDGYVGYEMRGYCNYRLLDHASFTLDETFNGYTNVYDIETIHPGMTAKVYVAYLLLDDDDGIFECYYDTGYIVNETIAYVCAES